MIKRNLLCLLLFVVSLLGCKKEDSGVPMVAVDFSIHVASTQYINLNMVGGWIYVYGGVNGIFIRRNSIDGFVALDRTSTYNVSQNNAVVIMPSNELYLIDTVSGSKFLAIDGSPHADGPSKVSLKSYKTIFNENTQTLRVYN